MTADAISSGLARYLEIERRLLAHRASRWFAGVTDGEDPAEARFFDELDDAGNALTGDERAALREIVIARATIRPGDTDVDVASPTRTGQGPRRVARVA
ncbi:MAG: hypothetical protein K8T90_02155 [Planctomycetes bacterium]|nr:hypothetical protein [Planctomycetota bacterium]